ncbi:SAVED domain-containing protein [Clostridium gasigenes]|uniref:SAVED domain-containing protein n=1 Tax=Clostridium gasigenes TaxID=94869 RepID=UPI00162A3F2D|nr:SAVED domain-containing protein [Clostridium gasigenes]MBB6622384.1 SAVED domain-containing protein [Clostridium gasigenes]
MATFSKNQAVMKNVLDEYSLIGYKKFNLNYLKKFTDESKFTEKVLQEVIDKQYKKINRIKKGIKNTDSFVYLGFPHVPIAILDGKNFSGTDNVILYEYKGALSNSSDKGFFELKKVYNSEMELSSNYKEKVLVGKALALKIEQSFPVGDDKIKELLGDIPIVYLKNNDVKRWGVESYSDVDKFAKEFYKILQWASEKGIDKIHIFATTPVSLTFSLGRVIEHYHPEIIAYNYNNNKYDWYINCTNKKVKKI